MNFGCMAYDDCTACTSNADYGYCHFIGENRIVKKLVAIALLALPMGAAADHLDVIEFKLDDGCTFSTFMQITTDFNSQWADGYAYHAEVLMPLQSNNLESLYWVGRSKDAASFGKAWDAWRSQLSDPNSAASKLWARLQACSTNLARRGYDTY